MLVSQNVYWQPGKGASRPGTRIRSRRRRKALAGYTTAHSRGELNRRAGPPKRVRKEQRTGLLRLRRLGMDRNRKAAFHELPCGIRYPNDEPVRSTASNAGVGGGSGDLTRCGI